MSKQARQRGRAGQRAQRARAKRQPRPSAALRTPRSTVAQRKRSRRRLVFGFLAAVVVVVVAVVLIVNLLGGDGENPAAKSRAGAEKVSGTGLIDVTAPPDAYKILYRIDDFAGGGHLVTSEEFAVRRPFESRLESRSGPPPGGEVTGVGLSGLGLFANQGKGAQPLVTTVVPGLPGSDMRLDVSMASLRKDGVLQPREHRKVLGRVCQVVRVGEPIGTGRKLAPKDDEYADDCIDDRGLLLEEVWYLKGKMVRRKLAVSVDDKPTFAPDFFNAKGTPLPLAQGGGQLIKITPTSRSSSGHWELPAPPAGFTFQARYLVLTTAPGTAPGQSAQPVQTFADVFVRGRDMVVIEQGDVIGHEGVFGGDKGSPVTAGDLTSPELVQSVYGNVVRSKLDNGRYVKVLATLVPEEVVKVAAALKLQPGGTVTPVDPPPPPTP